MERLGITKLQNINHNLGYAIFHKSGMLIFELGVEKMKYKFEHLLKLIGILQKECIHGKNIHIDELELDRKQVLLSKSSNLPIWYALFFGDRGLKNQGYQILGSLISDFEKLYSKAVSKDIAPNFFNETQFATHTYRLIHSNIDNVAQSEFNFKRFIHSGIVDWNIDYIR